MAHIVSRCLFIVLSLTTLSIGKTSRPAVTTSQTASAPAPSASCSLQSKSHTAHIICGQTGTLLHAAGLLEQWKSANGYSDCGISCYQDSSCVSFAYNTSSNNCQTFSKPIDKQRFREVRDGATYYWNRKCFNLVCSNGLASSLTVASTSTVPSTTSSSFLTSTTSAPAPSDTNTISSVTTFNTANYTYYQVTLPTFTTTYSAFFTTNVSVGNYAPTKTPQPSCFMDPDHPQGQFLITTYNNIPFVPAHDGFFHLLTANMFPNTSQAANEDYFQNIPSYELSTSPSSSSPYFDIFTFYKGSKQYIGFDVNSGTALLSKSSSQGQTPIKVSNFSVVTTVFAFNCEGFISIFYDDQMYQWQASTSGGNLTAIYPIQDNSTPLLLVPDNLPASLVAAGNNATSSKRGVYDPNCTAGSIGRCPNNPPALYAKPRPGVRPMQYNGCGSGSTANYIPQFGFGACCDYHDYCYDNCATGQVELCTNDYCAPGWWEGCNNQLYQCMIDTSCSQISWWDPIEKGGCYLAANFYAWVVTTYLGVDAFEEADSDRCGVYCSDDSPYCNGQCAGSSNNNSCGNCGWTCDTQYNYGCVNNECVCVADILTDNNNCGNCGWVCPYKTHCQQGRCTCDDEQCGDTCVDTQSNPNNCGTCGNSCGSGYCFEGQCQTIPTTTSGPPACYPTDAVQNGGFDQSNDSATPWQLFGSAYVDAGTSLTTPPNSLYMRAGDMAYQQIVLCPGITYQLQFVVLMTDTQGDMSVCIAGQNYDSYTYCSSGQDDFCNVSFEVVIPAAPAGSSGTTTPNPSCGDIQYDPTGTFAYTQLQLEWGTEDDPLDGPPTLLDSVSLVQS